MLQVLEQAFTQPTTKTFAVVSNFFALLTIGSIVSVVLETVPRFSVYSNVFFIVEWTAVILFTLEYCGRLYITKPARAYIFSFFGYVDLLAILPTFLGLGNFTFLKSARALRIVRLLRLVRLTKIARAPHVSEEAFGVLGLNVLIYFATLLCALLLAGTAVYLVEPQLFMSIPAGMWWSFKVFMGSLPVTLPETALGEALLVTTRFVGLLLLGLLVGVVGNIFRSLLLAKK